MSRGAVRVNLLDVLRDLLVSGRAADFLTGADMFAIAYAMAGVPQILSADNAVEVLLDNGLRMDLTKQALADRLAEGACQDRTAPLKTPSTR